MRKSANSLTEKPRNTMPRRRCLKQSQTTTDRTMMMVETCGSVATRASAVAAADRIASASDELRAMARDIELERERLREALEDAAAMAEEEEDEEEEDDDDAADAADARPAPAPRGELPPTPTPNDRRRSYSDDDDARIGRLPATPPRATFQVAESDFKPLPGTKPPIMYADIKGGGGGTEGGAKDGSRVAVHFDVKFRRITVATSRRRRASSRPSRPARASSRRSRSRTARFARPTSSRTASGSRSSRESPPTWSSGTPSYW